MCPLTVMKQLRTISWTGLWITIATEVVIKYVSTMDTHITVDCHSDPQNIVVNVHTDVPFEGMVYVSGKYGNLDCTAFGRKNTTTILKVPIKGCNTHEKETGLFMSHVTVQQHPMIVSAGDGEYEVGCKLFQGDLRVDTGNRVEVGATQQKAPAMTSPAPNPEVLLRIYDFENDVFVDTVRLGQVVELEITIRDGKMYQGSVSDCDAFNNNGTRFPVVRNFCPVDLTISDKVYVDDQSRTTGDYYLYVPFRVFRFLDGSKVMFSCNVIVCQHDCPWADCGDYLGMSYGRKRRSAPASGDAKTLTVTNEVTVMDEDHRMPRSAGTGIVEEEFPLPKDPSSQSTSNINKSLLPVPLEYLIGGTALVVSLLVSVCVNIYLLIFIKKKMERSRDSESTDEPSVQDSPFVYRNSLYDRGSLYDRYSPKMDWKYESREILYPPMPIRHASTTRRSHSFRY